MMMFETRLNDNFQTIIPSVYVEKYNLEEGDLVEWIEDENEELIIKFKKNPLKD